MSRTRPGFLAPLFRVSLFLLGLILASCLVGLLIRAGQVVWRVHANTGQDWIEIPAGTLMMGCDLRRDLYCAADELPARTAALTSFRLDRIEVTNGAYRECVRAGRCQEPVMRDEYDRFLRRDHPVAGVTWFQARAYCRWRGERLPTEAEWEWAARGADGRIWPWGDQFDCNRACSSVRPCHRYSTCPAGSHPTGRSPWGIEDLAGNVWEWVEDRYRPYGESSAGEIMTPGEEEEQPKVIRGGSWHDPEPYSLRSSGRSSGSPRQAYFNVGFRCAQ